MFPSPMLSVSAAQTCISSWLCPVRGVETVPLHAALGRTLAHNVLAPIQVPAYHNAAVDGYAFNSAALTTCHIALVIVERVFAGQLAQPMPSVNTCARVMTGAPLPVGCDTVIAQERVTLGQANQIFFASEAVKAGANRRIAGEDFRPGQLALPIGRRLNAVDLGLIASLGLTQVPVWQQVRVAFLSTGNELQAPGEPLAPGAIYDSNRYILYGMLSRLNVIATDLGIVGDTPAALHDLLRHAAAHADLIITSGSVSVGDADLLPGAFDALGELAFWKTAIRPGHPLAFGRIWSGQSPGTGKSALLFALPGNPGAMIVTFCQFVRDALLTLMGAAPAPLGLLPATTTHAIDKPPTRTQYQRAIAHRTVAGHWNVTPTLSQGSGLLSAMSQANCFIILDHAQTAVPAGSTVNICLLDGLL